MVCAQLAKCAAEGQHVVASDGIGDSLSAEQADAGTQEAIEPDDEENCHGASASNQLSQVLGCEKKSAYARPDPIW